MKIGEKIRNYRKQKKMTLEELSRKSGVALATLSRMETGKMPGTLRSHTSICEALGVSVSELYREIEDSKKTVEPGRDKKRPERLDGSGKVRHELLVASIAGKKMIPVIIRMAPGAGTPTENSSHGSERFLYLTKGSVDVEVSGKTYRLGKGDSLYFDPSLKHSLTNASRSETEIISITSPPGE